MEMGSKARVSEKKSGKAPRGEPPLKRTRSEKEGFDQTAHATSVSIENFVALKKQYEALLEHVQNLQAEQNRRDQVEQSNGFNSGSSDTYIKPKPSTSELNSKCGKAHSPVRNIEDVASKIIPESTPNDTSVIAAKSSRGNCQSKVTMQITKQACKQPKKPKKCTKETEFNRKDSRVDNESSPDRKNHQTESSGKVSCKENINNELSDCTRSNDNVQTLSKEICFAEEPPLVVYLARRYSGVPSFSSYPEDKSEEKYDFRFRTNARAVVNENLICTMCRVCGRYNVKCMNIFEEGSSISTLMQTYLPLEILRDDDPLPLTICLECVGVLQMTDDLAFRYLLTEPLFNREIYKSYPNLVGIVDPADKQWREFVNSKILNKFWDSQPPIDQRLPKRCSVGTIIKETCQICARREMDCLERCDEHIFKSIINIYLPSELEESHREFFRACLECVGILQVMDDLACRFYTVETCIQNHYEDFHEIETIPRKNHNNHDEPDKNGSSPGTCVLSVPPSGKFPLESQAGKLHVEPEGEAKQQSPVKVDYDFLRTNIHLGNILAKRCLTMDDKIELLKAGVPFSVIMQPKMSTSFAAESQNTSHPIKWEKASHPLHMLQFQMTVWLPPLSKNFLTNITPSNHVSLADFAEKAVSQPGHKTSAYIVNFKYEVNYHITSNGICSPVGFKISPGSYTDEAKKYLQMIINDSLHYEAQLLDLPNTIHEPADRSKDVCVIFHNPLLCSYCNKIVEKNKLLAHFQEKHMTQCHECKTFVLSPASLRKHQGEIHGYAYSKCNTCSNSLNNSIIECPHKFMCPLCQDQFRSFSPLIEHERQHYQAIIDLDNTLKQLNTIQHASGDCLDSIEDLVGMCSVCGKYCGDLREEECSHTFACNKCPEVFYNYPLYLQHRCRKRQSKQQGGSYFLRPESWKICIPQYLFTCPLCMRTKRQWESEYRLHYEECMQSFLLKNWIKLHHVDSVINLDSVPVQCALCSTNFSHINNFYSHYSTCFQKQTFFCTVCSEVIIARNRDQHSCEAKINVHVAELPVSPREINLKFTPYFECYVCKAGFTGRKSLSSHFATHKPDERSCQMCNFVFTSHEISSVISHLVDHYAAQQLMPLEGNEFGEKCEQCGNHFQSNLQRVIHILLSHAEAVLTCQNCKRKFISTEEFTAHHLSCQQALSQTIPPPTTQSYRPAILTRRTLPSQSNCCKIPVVKPSDCREHALVHFRSVSCAECKIIFNSRMNLGIHMRKAHPEKSFICRFCSQTFVFATSLTQHYQTIHKKEIHCCTNCYKTFSTNEKLAIHASEHLISDCLCKSCTKRKQPPTVFYSCDTCCKTFNRALDVYSHSSVMHSNMFPYLCASCGLQLSCIKTFVTHTAKCNVEELNSDSQYEKQKAVNFETSFRNFFLQERTKSSGEGSLDNNAVIANHTGSSKRKRKKPLECPLCGKSTGLTFSHLLNHCRAHNPIQMIEITSGSNSGQINCSIKECKKKFTSKELRDLHEIYQHSILLFQCKICYSEFNDHTEWADHEHFCNQWHNTFHPPSEQNLQCLIPCKRCKQAFTDRQSVIEHRNQAHAPGTWKCDRCSKVFRYFQQLKIHKKKNHERDKQFQDEKSSSGIKATNNQEQVPQNKSSSVKHTSNNTETCSLELALSTKFTSCHLCKQVYKRHSSRLFHYQMKHEDLFPVRCNHCSRGFLNVKSVASHQRKCNPEALKNNRKKVVCYRCGKLFKCQKDLKIHTHCSHRKKCLDLVKNYACRACNKSFETYKDLVSHARKYFIKCKRKWYCQDCGYWDKSVHILMHHDCKGKDAASKRHKGKKLTAVLERVRFTEIAGKNVPIDEFISTVGITKSQAAVNFIPIFDGLQAERDMPVEISQEVDCSELNILVSDDSILYVCSFCNSYLQSLPQLQIHLQEAHNLSMDNVILNGFEVT
ncbi:uncharacterized protein [Bemisia tabaci]|uniref:uncharacterized protein isoform X2 n=1 Tax=Bemisia tabaci TaxID=7038 RepID=UPI003B288212